MRYITEQLEVNAVGKGAAGWFRDDAFFETDNPRYRRAAAVDGWQKIWDFFGPHLGILTP
ncbi:hypothetical protein ACFZBZ_16830 [Streptomyces sp. NPDC008196]|uniref:hypothetical protein n=1 Tax=Streptomyces sp. NPDC008196 TaxID=3364819 RepID=UPI0036E2FE21